jgi:hypothetical protein
MFENRQILLGHPVFHDDELHPYHFSWCICFQWIVLYGCNFENGYINTPQMSSSNTTSSGRTKRVLRVFSVHSSHLWVRYNPHAISERGRHGSFSCCDWAGTVGDIVVGHCLLLDRLTAQRHRDFLFSGNCSNGAV